MHHNHNLFLRELSEPLAVRDAVPRPSSFNAEAHTVEAVIASAAPVQRQDGRGSFLEILDPAGLDLAASRGASVLDSHQQGGIKNILGTLDEVRIEGDQVVGLIRFSSRPEIAPVVDDIRSGIVQHLSVGYQVETWRDGTDGNDNRTRTATRWTIREASFVSVPADRNARTRAANLDRGPNSDHAAINQQIRALGTRAGVGANVVNDLIDRGATVAEAREEILFEMQIRGAANIRSEHNMLTMDNPEARTRAMGEALYTRINPRSAPSGAARQFVGLTIPELAREVLVHSGISVHGASSVSLIERALHTTSDFALILADSVNRTLRASYAAAPSGIRQLARQTTANDFRTKHRLMLDSTGLTLEKVNEHGEFRSGTMAEGEETYSISTFGRIVGITRQVMVNDDVGAFSTIAARLGAAAAAFEAQFLTNLVVGPAGVGPAMKDTKAVFHTDHGNINTVTGAAPSETTLSAARLAMRKQTGLGGGLIDVTPWAVVVPPDLETATEKLLTAIQAVTVDEVNPFAQLRLVVEPRLTDTYRWYVWANPATVDGLEYAYLSGAPGPQTESRAGFEVDGVEVKVRLDFGGGWVDHRGAYSDAGH